MNKLPGQTMSCFKLAGTDNVITLSLSRQKMLLFEMDE